MAITIPELNSVSVVDDTDNIMLTHSNGNSEKISGSAFKADMIKNKIENNNGHAVSVNAVSTIMATSTTITGPELGTGGNIKILFTSAIAGVDTSTGLTLTYNGSPIAVKVGKDGALEDFKAVEVSSGVYKYLQAYTTLELIYNGTYFIIVGNPVVLSDTLYCIRANGYQAVDEVASDNMNSVSSNAVAGAIDTAKNSIKFIISPSNLFSSFAALNAAITNFTGFRFDTVSLTPEASDPNAPITTANYYWWNVITYGAASRKTQIAIQAYNKGFSTAGYMYVRTYHDETWSAWFQK